MKLATILATVLATAAYVAADVNPANPTQTQKGVEEPSAAPTLGAQVVQGCYKSAGDMKNMGVVPFNSKSSCAHDTCNAQGYKVAGTTQGGTCYCGNSYPNKSDLVDDSKCNIGCKGYDWQACGGKDTWTIYNTGISVLVDGEDPEADTDSTSSSSSSSPASQATAVVTISGAVVVVTETSTPSNNDDSGSSKPNVAGIAAGVVVGVVALGGLSLLAFFLIRRRRNHDIEEEHRRNAAVNAFINGSKPPSSSGGLSVSDSRLDPVMAQRRMSSGSIADNEDYSRRILRVTNA